MESEINNKNNAHLLSVVFPTAKLNLYTRQIPTSKRKNCSKRPARAKSESCLALLRRWEPAQMFKTDLSHFTMWIVLGALQM